MKKRNDNKEAAGEINSGLLREIAEKGVPPVYLREYVTKAYATKSPATILSDGKWRKHKASLWNVFSLAGFSNLLFFIRLSKTQSPDAGNIFIIPRVEAAHVDQPDHWFTLYDARFHPGSVFAYNRVNPKYVADMQDSYSCQQCGNKRFRLALGFEISPECSNPNDLSGFALAVECESCGWKGIVYQDEIVKK
ncbi:hypothetical protein JW926_16420 [Candidatus Sumerlaeota bacterium]|nr:hypothetical protein [Candidatus Sumerlaeota bacterium]